MATISPEVLADLPPGFWSGSLAVGAGIAADGVIATFGVAATLRRSWARWAYWTLGVGLTHWLFPMVGFSIGWAARERDWLVRSVYLIGALLLARHLARNVVGPALRGGAFAAHRPATYGELSLLILAVSIDALLAGPAQSVIARSWSAAELMLFFGLVAASVLALLGASALISIGALQVAARRPAGRPAGRGLTALVTGSWTLEVAVFTGFTVLSLVRALLPAAGPAVPGALAAGLAAAGGLWLLGAERIRSYGRGIVAALLDGEP